MRTYSFVDTVATLVGPGVNVSLGSGSGVAEEGITLENISDLSTMTIGADGQGFHSMHADRSGRITVRILKTAPLNALLNAALLFQRASSANFGQNTLTVGNTGLRDASVGQGVGFAKVPTIEYAKDGRFNEWLFEAIELQIGLG